MEFTSDAAVAIAGATSDVWANPTGHSLSITPGLSWHTKYKICVYSNDASCNSIQVFSTLSTVNNDQSDLNWSARGFQANNHALANLYLMDTLFVDYYLTVPNTTTFYLNIKGISSSGGVLGILTTTGTHVGTIISARRIA